MDAESEWMGVESEWMGEESEWNPSGSRVELWDACGAGAERVWGRN